MPLGVLSHLENLETRAHKIGLKQKGMREHQENVARLKMRIQELRCQRDELKTKLNVCRSLVGATHILFFCILLRYKL